MNRYSCYCTKEQTKKAFELGAPIEEKMSYVKKRGHLTLHREAIPPTSEQMIGWLESNYFGSIEPCKYGDGSEEWGYRIFDKNMNAILWHNSKDKQLYSRKEATLAAIDAALECLTNNKK